jgi:outer membrane protein assembly factor BamB
MIMKTPNRLFVAVICFLTVTFTVNVFAQDWPQWRGTNRDGKVSGFKAPQTWPSSVTPLWTVAVGLGDASPVIAGGKLYTFTRQGDEEVIRCIDSRTGKDLWQNKYPSAAITGPSSSQHPGPRSTPTIGEGKIVTLGVGGVLSCMDAGTGNLVWRNEEFTKDLPAFFTSLSPLIFDGMCVVHLGGKENGAVVAFELKTGKQKWQSPGDGPSYASLSMMNINGKKQIVDLTAKNLMGIDPANGKVLWQIPVPTENRFYNAASPVIDGQTIIITGQGQGTKAIKIEKQGDEFAVKELWKNAELGTKWNTPVLKDGFLYGISDGRKLFCMNAATGQTAWVDTKLHNDFGTIVDVGSLIIALPQTSNLVDFKPEEKAYNEVAVLKVAESPTYSYPLLAGNRLFVKDKESLTLMIIK